jgi:hypothetical protein
VSREQPNGKASDLSPDFRFGHGTLSAQNRRGADPYDGRILSARALIV